MKKIIIVFICIATFSANAQDKAKSKNTGYQNILKFSVVNFLDNTILLSYERKINNSTGLMLSGGVSYKVNQGTGEVTEGYKGEFQYKHFVHTKEKENSSISIYFAPYFLYKYSEKETFWSEWPPYNYHYIYYFNSFSGGILFGMNFTIEKKIVIDLYAGGGIKRTFGAQMRDNINYYCGSIWELGYNGITPKAGIDVGFKF